MMKVILVIAAASEVVAIRMESIPEGTTNPVNNEQVDNSNGTPTSGDEDDGENQAPNIVPQQDAVVVEGGESSKPGPESKQIYDAGKAVDEPLLESGSLAIALSPFSTELESPANLSDQDILGGVDALVQQEKEEEAKTQKAIANLPEPASVEEDAAELERQAASEKIAAASTAPVQETDDVIEIGSDETYELPPTPDLKKENERTTHAKAPERSTAFPDFFTNNVSRGYPQFTSNNTVENRTVFNGGSSFKAAASKAEPSVTTPEDSSSSAAEINTDAVRNSATSTSGIPVQTSVVTVHPLSETEQISKDVAHPFGWSMSSLVSGLRGVLGSGNEKFWPANEEDAKIYDPVASKLESLLAEDQAPEERENAATALQTTFRGRQVRKAVAKEKREKKQQEDVHASVSQAVENDGVTADKPFQTFSKPLLTARVGRTESTAKYVTWELPSLAVSPEELKAKFEQ